MLNFSKNYTTYKSLHKGPSPVVQSTYTTDGRGHWFPLTCRPRQRTVIVIPFRDRDDHLKIFLDHYVPILQRQLLDYTILVVEQRDFTRRFNKGVMFNAGYKTALSMIDDNQAPLCLILHDIDLLLENDLLTYECSQHPTHLSVGIDTMQYRMPYTLLFGGVVAIFGEQFNISNGFSNLFFGWGGEDDDFRGRLGKAGLSPVHYENRSIARYSMIIHYPAVRNEVSFGRIQKNHKSDRVAVTKEIIVEQRNCSTLEQKFVGMLNFSKNYTTYKSLHKGPSPVVQSTYTTDGRGRWFPLTCRPRQRTIIVIPFRDRDEHLKIFLDHYVPILQRQLLDYTILVVEQDSTQRFNRGAMFNVGHKTALSMTDEDQAPLCFILHDIDLLLENDRLTYECSQHPTHLSVGVDTFEYRLPYTYLFGGVVAIFGEQFNISNGFSNLFFGWGGEDDDFRARLVEAGLFPVQHENGSIARYSMITHDQVEKNEARVDLWSTGPERFHCDGLNSVEYKVDSIHYKEHYVLIKIDMPTDLKTSSMCLDCFSGGLKTKTIQKAVNTSTVNNTVNSVNNTVNSTVNNTVNSTVNITVSEICKMT
ncbi:unnamed protein product [Owenia fusiformis]|uniref:Beta-1,4-N-acetylgalactosaminyltransferase bre-4 n=1 Tax=Owenia fusiformis TaxID=6347 RepID=A0A8S4NC62_OWEFU|nr:unnamed protein product [Owenia fusiformis]